MTGRPRKAKNQPTEAKPPKYTQLSLTDKCKILERLEAGEKNVTIAADYGVVHSAISYIKKNKESIYEQKAVLEQQQGNEQKTRRTSTDTSAFETGIYKWFCQKRLLGEPISGPLLREKALIYNEKLGGPSSFKASNGWIHKFKIRHGIRELCMKGEKLSGDIDSSSVFVVDFNKLITEGGYDIDNVYNADETGLGWRSLPRKTLTAKNETEVAGRKVLKDRVTVMACANASGTHRIPLLVIGKSKKPRCFKNVKTLPVNYRGQQSAWIDRKIFTDWYVNIFLPAVKQRKSGKNEKFLLLLDDAPSHPSEKDLNAIDESCTVIFLPPNVTALIQPMDQGVIEATKKYYKKALLRQLLLEEELDEGDTVTEFLKKWNMLDCCETIARAWELLTESTLRNAWKKILSADNIDISVPSVHDDSDITYLVRKVPGYETFTNEETHAWLEEDTFQPVWHILNDDELLSLTQPAEDTIDTDFNNSQEEAGDTTEEELPEPREVLKSLNRVIEWYRGRWESEPNDFMPFFKIRDLVETSILDP